MKRDASDTNVLFIIADQHKKAVTGCYGHPLVQTPNIDALAARGVRFSSAYCASPLCGPSRSALMTGTHPHTCGGLTHTQLPPLRIMPTLGTVFREAGYVTGSIGKMHIRGEDDVRDLGFDERELRYYTYAYRDYIIAVGEENVDRYNTYRGGSRAPKRDYYNPDNRPVDMDEPMMYDALVAERSIAFLERHRRDRFFLFVGFEKPHPEWYAPAAFHALYDPAKVTLPETLREKAPGIPESISRRQTAADRYTDDQVRGAMAAYYANVSCLDAKVGRVLEALERLGLAEKTLVVYTTDHGDMLFEHGMVQKHCFYEPAVAVPLVMACPGLVPAGVVRDHVVGFIDLFPTLLDLTGLAHPDGLEGTSLTDVLTGEAPEEGRAAFAEFYKRGISERMVRTAEWKYIHMEGEIPQLYDERNDPLERTNLAPDPAYAEVCRELRERVLAGWEMPDADVIRPPKR